MGAPLQTLRAAVDPQSFVYAGAHAQALSEQRTLSGRYGSGEISPALGGKRRAEARDEAQKRRIEQKKGDDSHHLLTQVTKKRTGAEEFRQHYVV